MCRLGGDGTFPNHTNMLAFDFAQAAVRDFWASECYNMTQTVSAESARACAVLPALSRAGPDARVAGQGYVDGCFSDRSDGTPCGGGEDYIQGHVQVHQELQEKLGNGPLIANRTAQTPSSDPVVSQSR